MTLKPANMADAECEYAFLAQVPAEESGFSNPLAGISYADFLATGLPKMIAHAEGRRLPEGFVPETDFFLWDGDEIVGLFRIRHHLNDSLRAHAGHIGYCIRRDCRGRGYATRGLALAVEQAKRLIAEDEIYLSARIDNPGSWKAQLKNGATIHHSDGVEHYARIRIR